MQLSFIVDFIDNLKTLFLVYLKLYTHNIMSNPQEVGMGRGRGAPGGMPGGMMPGGMRGMGMGGGGGSLRSQSYGSLCRLTK